MYPDDRDDAPAVLVPDGNSYSFVVVYVDPDQAVAHQRSDPEGMFQFPYPWAPLAPGYDQSVTSVEETTLSVVMVTVLQNRPQQDREIRCLCALLVNPDQEQAFPPAHNVSWIGTDSTTAGWLQQTGIYESRMLFPVYRAVERADGDPLRG
jgi:hypothetical protein